MAKPKLRTFLPDFIIAGASKSGSTSLFNYLRQHPETLMSDRDNLDFFTRGENLSDVDSYRNHFTIGKNEPRPTIVGEGTANYLFVHQVPQRMVRVLPDPFKLVFLLRHPRERAVSHYWHKYKKFEETRSIHEVFFFDATDPQEVIDQELRRVRAAESSENIDVEPVKRKFDPGDHLIPFRYVRNSFYHLHLRVFLEHIPPDRILVLFTEELKENPEKTFRSLAEFLGIDPEFTPENLGKRYNKTRVPNRDWFSGFLHDVVKPLTPPPLKQSNLLQRLYNRLAFGSKPETPPEVRQHLDRILQPEARDVSTLLGRDVACPWEFEIEPSPSG